MKLYRVPLLFLLFMVLTGCDGVTPMPEPATPILDPSPAPPVADAGWHFLVSHDGGAVQIKRLSQGWSAFHPASWGAPIRRGDLILPPPGGAATILCADLTLHTLREEAGNPCQVSEPDLFWQGVHIINPMSPGSPIPAIIYPRSTRILEERPWLRWQDSGAASYTVAIVADGRAVWQETGVTGTELRYPDNAPPLEAGRDYLLEVKDEDSGLSSGQEPLRGLGFTLLSPEETAVVHQKAAGILALPLDDTGKQFAMGVYYAGPELYGAALSALDEAIALQESPQLWLWRGRVLVAMRLNAEAEAAYAAASALAATLGDLESQAQAQTQLWLITGDETYWHAAVALYQQLGDAQAVADLQNSR